MANAKHKQWIKDITSWADGNLSELYGAKYNGSPFQRHHVKGRTYKQNKVHIGDYFILPVPFDLHDVSSNHPLNVTHHKHAFTGVFGKQSDLFADMVYLMELEGYEIPPIDVMNAIRGTGA